MRNNTSWLQHIPKHWEVKRLKDVVSCNDDVLPENLNANSTIQYIEISDVDSDKGITNVSNISFGEAPSRARRITKKGDIVVSTVRTYLKAIATIHDDDLIVSTGFAVLRPNPTIISSFLHYAILNEYVLDDIIKNSTGVSYPAIQSSKLIAMPIPLPPLSEQEKIAHYLDKKVGDIDQKVSLIEKKIERYQLLKKSIINKVVTKGLHLEAPLKDSQISWLGHIPQHWEVKRVKDIVSSIFMGTSPAYEYEVENENYVFGQRNNQLYKIDFNGLKHAKNEFFNSRSEYEYLSYGDVIINTLGGGSVGRVGYFDYIGDKRMITDGHVMILRSNNYSTRYLYYYLHSKRRELENLASGSTNQSFFNISDIVVLYLPMPPLYEQQEIASYLDQKCADIDAIIANCTAQIEKYKTLKRALINEVVTGQRTIE